MNKHDFNLASEWYDDLDDSSKQYLYDTLQLKIPFAKHFDDLLSEDQEKIKKYMETSGR